MIKEILVQLTRGESLSYDEAKLVFEAILCLSISPAQIAAVLVALQMKGETEDEIAAAASVIREKATKVNAAERFMGIAGSQPVVDTCGTGGSGLNKFNVSTAVAFVVAAAGFTVAKHGNKAMSSNCGSADVMEALGVRVNSPVSCMEQALNKVGIGFLYAPLYHPALVQVAQVRREIGVRTVFNILGPLCNPAGANYQLLGVYSRQLLPVLARVLRTLGSASALVVYGKDVCDEISLTGPTDACLLKRRAIVQLRLNPSDFGLKKIKLKDILVKDANSSAQMILDVFAGRTSAARDLVLANAGACFYLLGKAAHLKAGARLAAELLDQGKAAEKLLQFKTFVSTYA